VGRERGGSALSDGRVAGTPWAGASTPELFSAYRRILAELRGRGIVRTDNAPAGDYAEFLVARAYDGELAPSSEKSWDVLTKGRKLQVKCRVVSDPVGPRQRQLSPFRTFGFHAAVVVLFRNTDYSVLRAVEVPVDLVKKRATYREHVNGHVVRVTQDLLDHPDCRDVTELLAAAADGI